MINNLFSIFDPSSSYIKLNWLIILIPLLIIIKIIKKLNRNIKNLIILIKKTILIEIQPLISKLNKKGITRIFRSIFILICIRNLLAIIPFNFTISAHIIISFPLALIIWIRIILFGWINNSKNIIAHSVPNGTPLVLINFIVLIELTRNLIRPITLAIRLSANIVAGHLLLRLLANFAIIRNSNMLLSSPIIIIIIILELAVSIIQAYVFITLLTLYSTEIH